jgi:hypothetical protein
MDVDDNRDLERTLALYRDVCDAARIEPLPDDETRDSARWMLALLRPAFERQFRLH